VTSRDFHLAFDSGPSLIHWMIEENILPERIPAGRIACAPCNMVDVVASGAWSCRVALVTCSPCLEIFFSMYPHKVNNPITD
jgi:hypothetical protein